MKFIRTLEDDRMARLLDEAGEASVSVHPSGVAPRATMRRAGKARD
jgi:hypothetical protein